MSDKLEYYEVRLYDTVDQLDPCPYCGLDRIIVQHHDEAYEEADEYRIEHLDEKAAVTEGCFTMYYSFGNIDKAIEKANSCYRKDKRKTIRVDYDLFMEMMSKYDRIIETFEKWQVSNKDLEIEIQRPVEIKIQEG